MKLFSFKHEKHYLSVEEAKHILKYGYKDVTVEVAASKEIEDLEIYIKSKAGAGFRAVTRIFQDYNQDLVDELVKHFRGNGFIADTYRNPEIQNMVVLIIGW